MDDGWLLKDHHGVLRLLSGDWAHDGVLRLLLRFCVMVLLQLRCGSGGLDILMVMVVVQVVLLLAVVLRGKHLLLLLLLGITLLLLSLGGFKRVQFLQDVHKHGLFGFYIGLVGIIDKVHV